MGFLDKAAAKVSEATKAAQEGIAEQTAKRKADGLLRELGAWTYAKHKGGFDDADANIARVLGELAAHEAEYGELGAKEEPRPAASAAAAAAARRPPPPPAAASAARPAGPPRRRPAPPPPAAAGPRSAARRPEPPAPRAAGPARRPPPPPPGDPVPPPPPPA